jgi:hypothetical protein
MGLFRGYGLPKQGLAALALLAALGPSAHADFYLHPWEEFRGEEKRPHLIPVLRYYTSSSNFDTTGSAIAPGTLDSYTRLQVDTSFIYAFNARWTGYIRASWGSSILTHQGTSDSVFGLTDQTVGVNYRLFPNPEKQPGSSLGEKAQAQQTSMDLQVQMDFPGYSTATQASKNLPGLGDGSLDLTAGAFLNVPLGKPWGGYMKMVLGGGFTYRTGGFSAALPYAAGLQFEPHDQGFLFSLMGSGFMSMKTDSTTSLSLQGTSSGGSFITGAVNPSLLQATGKLGYRFTSGWTLTLAGTEALWGQSAPRGFMGAGGLEIPFGQSGKEPLPKDPALVVPKKYGQVNKGFVTYSLEAKVQRVSDRINQLRIDKGTQQGVEVGQLFDIFVVRPDGTVGDSVARCKVTSVRNDDSTLSIVEYIREVFIEEGFLARRLVQ